MDAIGSLETKSKTKGSDLSSYGTDKKCITGPMLKLQRRRMRIIKLGNIYFNVLMYEKIEKKNDPTVERAFHTFASVRSKHDRNHSFSYMAIRRRLISSLNRN